MKDMRELFELSIKERERSLGRPVTAQEANEIERSIAVLVCYGGPLAVKISIDTLKSMLHEAEK
jgi:hypothetical protein